jgi:hypothetical protein
VNTLDFVLLGNARAALAWLWTIAESAPEEAAGAVLDMFGSLETGSVPDADRVVVVLDDPVALLAAADEAPAARVVAFRYRQLVGQLVDRGSERLLVIAADELRHEGMPQRVCEHLGLTPPSALSAPPDDSLPPLPPTRRALLLAAVRDDIEELERLAGREFRSWRYGSVPETVAAIEPDPATAGRLLFYVGRDHEVEAPAAAQRVDDWNVLPVRLGPMLDTIEHMTIVDPMSFPFDALREHHRSIPVAIRLPLGWTADDIVTLLGQPALSKLTALDRVATLDDEVWSQLRRRYSWPRGMRVSDRALLAGDAAGPRTGITRHFRRKADFRAVRTALLREVDAALDALPAGEQLAALVIGDDLSEWCSTLPLRKASVLGVSSDGMEAERAGRDFPEWEFATELPLDAVERFHVALCAYVLCADSPDRRRLRLAVTLQSLRVGGILVILDRFLEGHGGVSNGAPTPRELLGEIRSAAAGNVVVRDVEAIRLPREDLTSTGLLAFAKLGRPERL